MNCKLFSWTTFMSILVIMMKKKKRNQWLPAAEKFTCKQNKPKWRQMYKPCFVHQWVWKRQRIDSTQSALKAAFHACHNYAERSSITAASRASPCMQSISANKWPSFALSHNGLKKQINVGQLKIFLFCPLLSDNNIYQCQVIAVAA